MTISCSTKVCSFGNQVVEKVENEQAQYENGRYVYRFENSPMCEYMITFINKLKQLPEKNLKNSVLENFSVIQVSWALLFSCYFWISNNNKIKIHFVYYLKVNKKSRHQGTFAHNSVRIRSVHERTRRPACNIPSHEQITNVIFSI